MKVDLKTIKKEYYNLIAKIKQWNYEYYVLNQSTVSDAIYDQYYQKLQAIENLYPQLVKFDSPTQQVGSSVQSSNLLKVAHTTPMLSLANAFNEADLLKFDQQIKKLTGYHEIDYVVELKIDGLSIAVGYQEQQLKFAATRGDGKVGEDITNNIKMIATIPQSLNNKQFHDIEVRGEIYLSKNDFICLNQKQSAANLPLFANPRNAASGTIRQLDLNVIKTRKLNAFFYYLNRSQQYNIKTQQAVLEVLTTLGFNVNPEWQFCPNIDAVLAYVRKYSQQREQLPYEIDGIVVKINDLSLYSLLGTTSKAPKWAIAYKFPALITTTKLLRIFPTVGRTGKITYNAQLEPVTLAGSIITYATLHNGSYVLTKDLRVNDIVEIKKAGDIIPEVIQPILAFRSENSSKFVKATHCPECHSLLQELPDEVDQYCINNKCRARLLKALIHFCCRDAMDIVGLNEKILQRFLTLNWINDVADIFALINYRTEILQLAKFGEKSFNNLITNIIKAKNNSLERLLFGLGIRHVGQKTAQILASQFSTLSNIQAASEADLASIANVGVTIAKSIVAYFANPANQTIIKKLISFNINQSYYQPSLKNRQLLIGHSVVITGTLSKNRHFFVDLLTKNGAKVVSTVSKNTSFLVVGTNPGSKVLLAQKLKVKLMNETELLSLLGLETKI